MMNQLAKIVLLVEDDVMVRLVGADMLADAGYRVIEAASADEALGILRDRAAVDVLFTDVRMPGSMDGLKLAEVVHAHWPHIRILVTSADHRPSEGVLPDDGRFLPKPYTMHTLCRQVDELAS